MPKFRPTFGRGGAYAALAAFALSPSILLAVNLTDNDPEAVSFSESFERFTPAGVDSALARHFDLADLQDEVNFAFTPAGKAGSDRSVTIVVRAPGKSAKFVQSAKQARAALADVAQEKKPVVLGMTSYNLGAAKGLQSFTPAVGAGVKNDEPRLTAAGNGGGFRLDSADREKVASRLNGDLATSGMPRANSGLAVEQDRDLEGSLKVLKGVQVTAGLRDEADKNIRLTDDVPDNQAVYVGTMITF